MESKNKVKARQCQKHDTEESWQKAGENGFVPLKAEFIVYDADNEKSPRFKIGDGVTNINDLPFAGEGSTSGSISITDDGNGNVTISASDGISITDDGNGNVTIK